MAYLGYLPQALLRWPYADKFLHFLLFGGVAFWLEFWLRPSTQARRSLLAAVPLAILVPLAIAALEEGVQSFSSLRTADWGDLTADLAGMVVFWRLSQMWRVC
jgi:VanZ family protein